MKDPGRPRLPDFISVIVTTYNREDALDALLSALSAQTDRCRISRCRSPQSRDSRLPRRVLHLS